MSKAKTTNRNNKVTLFVRSVNKTNYNWVMKEASKRNMAMTDFVNQLLTTVRKNDLT